MNDITAQKLDLFTAARNVMALEAMSQVRAQAGATPAVKLYDSRGNIITPDAWYSYRKRSAGNKGSMKNWKPQRQYSISQEARDREAIVARSVDLTNSDPHAAGVVDTFAVTVAGSGLSPIPALEADVLPYDKDRIRAIQLTQRSIYRKWYPIADATGRFSFGSIQYLCIRNLVEYGEYFILLYMIEDDVRPYRLACHVINPLRVKTPLDKIADNNIRDGIELGPHGNPVAYWVKLSSPNGISSLPDTSQYFRRIPASVGHRLNVIHRFIPKEPEQLRGWPAMTPSMKFFRDLNDYLDTELTSNIIASAISMFIETGTTDPFQIAQNFTTTTDTGVNPAGGAMAKDIRYQEVDGGLIYYGNLNQKPHLLSPSRPGSTFDPFTKIIKKGMSMGVNLPYPIAFKDTDGVNFAGFRSVMLDAWRVFMMYRTSLAEDTCRPIYTMLQEEAYLKGELDVKEFYEFHSEVTRADWRGDPKGDIEPIKAAQADILLIQNNLKTRAAAIAERGGDIRSVMDQLEEEQQMMEERGLTEEKITPEKGATWAEEENNDHPKGTPRNTDDTVDDETIDENNMEQS